MTQHALPDNLSFPTNQTFIIKTIMTLSDKGDKKILIDTYASSQERNPIFAFDCLVCQSNKASYTFTNFCVSQYGLQELELHHHTYDHKYKCQRAKEGSKKRRRFFRLSSIQRGRPGISSLVCNIIRRQ